MQALILAAGYGKRLGELTKKTPKCLIKIKSKSLIDIWLEKLNNLGVKKIYINIHYKKKKIITHLRKSPYRKKIVLLNEKELLGTAGTLKKNLKYFQNESLIMLHADNYTEDNLKGFVKFYKKNRNNSDIFIFTFLTKDFLNSGMLRYNNKKILTEFTEKPSTYKGSIANGGIFIMNKTFLNNFKSEKNTYDFSKDMLPRLIGKAKCYTTKFFFIDIGLRKKLKIARSRF